MVMVTYQYQMPLTSALNYGYSDKCHVRYILLPNKGIGEELQRGVKMPLLKCLLKRGAEP